MNSNHQSFVRWFRESSPYIHTHRDSTFVVCFGGEVFLDGGFSSLAQDFALLNSLGIRLVLVHGIRPQIEERLKSKNIVSKFKNGLRITDDIALECVKEAAGIVRVEIEANMSMGIANTPMSGARIHVASGNFVTAKPLGVIDGTDFCHSGEVRRVDTKSIREKLNQNNIVLISPIGYSQTGDIFNLSAELVATAVAAEIGTEKLILLMEQDFDNADETFNVNQMTIDEAQRIVEKNRSLPAEISQHLKAGISACESGVDRVHLINRKTEGSILLELFTHDGIGTLISSTPFEALRGATINDSGGIMKLIFPLEQAGILVERKQENLEMEINNFSVIERDGLIAGCAAIDFHPNEGMAELKCLALHTEYRGENRGDRLLSYIENQAKSKELKKLFVLTTRSSQWFLERGFNEATLAELPEKRRCLYDPTRNSKILIKQLL